jgi:hypothetical protein
MSDTSRGDISLHNNHAIGLQPEIGGIGLHKPGDEGWIVGLALNVDLRHFRKAGSNTGFMTLNWLELAIPAAHGTYVGRIEGWDSFKIEYYSEFFKPVKSQLLPGGDEWTTFEWLDTFDENDPYFYYGWGLRTDNMPPTGYRKRMTVAYMGVNFPISDNVRPFFANVPPEDWLLKNLKPSAPAGQWELKAGMSSFTVDAGVMQDSYELFRVVEGRARFVKNDIDFVKQNDFWIGEKDIDLSGVFWGSDSNPGELKIMSGPASGMTFRIVQYFHTGNNPPSGFPANMWLLKTHPLDGILSDKGVGTGNKYKLTSPYNKSVFKLLEHYVIYEPGVYEEEDLVWKFTPIL